MASFDHGDATIHYDDIGDGYPIFLIAPGGMRSAAEVWGNVAWDPRTLADTYRVIAMDQRNAGRSTAPVRAGDGWHVYTADQLALLDHLGIDRCHVLGMCIGGPYIMGLLAAAPERFASAVILQPVGIVSDENRAALAEMFDNWAGLIADDHPEAGPDDWARFRRNMWGGEFVLTVTPEQASTVTTPMLVLMGDDLYHPPETSQELVARAPEATLIENWKQGDAHTAALATIRDFLAQHTR